jgi:hypothetical protein
MYSMYSMLGANYEASSRGVVYLPNFMNIGTGVQAISRFCFSDLNECNVGITEEKCL